MSTVIGAMEAYLKLNIEDFERNLEAARKQVESVSAGFDVLTSVGDTMTSVGNKLTLGLTTPVVALGTACTKTTADFDSAMSKVSAISGATGDSLQALRDKAKEMGEKTKFSATESAEAFTYMAMAGWDTEQMLDGISGIMNLAAADGLDLATTSDIVTDALTAFGLQASDSAHFADVLAKASSSANTNVSMLGESFKYVAPVAGAMGYSVEDVGVALGLMANSGIKAGQAGTSLRAALTRMAKPTDKAALLMEKYGISIANSDGSMKSLDEVMQILRTSMGDLTEAEQIQAATTIFGQEAMSGMLAIINASDEDFGKLTDAINDADGTAQQMADTMNDNLSGQLTLLKSQLEGVAIQIGEMLIPHIRNLLTHVSEWITKFSDLFKEHGDLIIKVVALVAAIGPVLSIVGKCISIFGTFKSAITNVSAVLTAANTSLVAAGSSLAAVIAPVIAVVAVIGVLVAAFKHLWETNEGFRTAMTEIWNGIVQKFQSFCDGIVERLNSLGFDFEDIVDVLRTIWEGFCNLIAPVFEGAFNVVATFLSVILDVILGIVDVFINLFSGNWEGAWNSVLTIFQTIWNGLVEWFTIILQTLKSVADVFLGWFGTDWQTVWTAIQQFFINIWNGIVSFFQGIVTWFQTTFTNIANFFTTTWTTISTTVTGIVSGLVNGVIGLVTGLVTNVTTFFTNLKTSISNIFTAIHTTASNIWNNIKTTVYNMVSAIKNSVLIVFDNIKSGVTTAMTNVKNAIVNGFTNAVSFVKGLPKQALTWGKDMITGFADGVKEKMNALINKVKEMAEKVKSYLHFSRPDVGPLRDYETWMPDMVQGLTKTLESASPRLIDSIKAMSSSMSEALNGGTYEMALAGASGGNIRVGGASIASNDYSALNKSNESQVVEKTEIHIDKIEVRDDNDLEAVTQGLYNKQDQNLRALGRRSL